MSLAPIACNVVCGCGRIGSGGAGMGATLMDGLDTLLIAGLEEEVHEAELWLASHFDVNNGRGDINVFEMTIRVIGGLLAAYEMRGTPIFLQRAREVADRLIVAFETYVDRGEATGAAGLSAALTGRFVPQAPCAAYALTSPRCVVLFGAESNAFALLQPDGHSRVDREPGAP